MCFSAPNSNRWAAFGESWSAQSVSSTVAGSHVRIVPVRSEDLFIMLSAWGRGSGRWEQWICLSKSIAILAEAVLSFVNLQCFDRWEMLLYNCLGFVVDWGMFVLAAETDCNYIALGVPSWGQLLQKLKNWKTPLLSIS